jgi:hypothetical protein
MRTTRLLASWSAIVLVTSGGAGCAVAARSAPQGVRAEEVQLQPTRQEQRQLRDSANAQAVADEVGPRVSVMADFDYSGGSRRVDATFHMYDDAYVIVGSLDAAGRLTVVFPSAPGDDGFVRGDKIYHVPSFFAGFGDEYASRYSNYRYQAHNAASRYDSYDAGLGYVFVIASWRPMRLDRIANGSRWQSYDVADISYMSDPREAVEELGATIAGDNRESYTIEYAHYTTTNFGNYSFSDFDAVNSGCLAYRGYGFFSSAPLLFSPYAGFPQSSLGFGSLGCSSALNYGYYGGGYGYGYGTPAFPAPFIPRRPNVPIGSPVFHLPRVPGTVALHRPPESNPPTPVGGATAAINGSSQYRRPGLTAEDAAGPRGQGQRSGVTNGNELAHRPTIQQMIGNRRAPGESQNAWQGMGMRDNTGSINRAAGSTNRGGLSYPRPGDTGARMTGARESGRSFSPETRGTPRGGESARMSPSHSAPPRAESHPAPAHSEPARSAPAASSSSGSKKP